MDPSEPSVDELVALLQARVAQRRAAGEYPDDLEERLDAHFRRLLGPAAGVPAEWWNELDARLAAIARPVGERRSRRAHVEDDLAAMRAAIETLARVTRAVYDGGQQGLVQQIDDLRADLSRSRALARRRRALQTAGDCRAGLVDRAARLVRLGRVRTRLSRQRGERARPVPRPRGPLRRLRAGARRRIRPRRVPRSAARDRCRGERDRGRRRSRVRGRSAASTCASATPRHTSRHSPTRVSAACARCRSSST